MNVPESNRTVPSKERSDTEAVSKNGDAALTTLRDSYIEPKFNHVPYSAYVSFATMILQLVMLLLQLALTLKIREGSEWARAGLTAVTVLTIAYSIILTVAGLESGGGGTVAVAIISIPLTAFF